MQIPTGSYCNQPSIFEAILEELSQKNIETEQELLEERHLSPSSAHTCNDNTREEPSCLWFWTEDVPLVLPEDQDHLALTLEFKKIASCREEQESKLASILQGQRKEVRRAGEQEYVAKSSKSLSPRKTKRIDKQKSFRLMEESS